ncbi:LAFA_0E08658g1_1 [Lachancea sp. 'fantastica']|nr:LAFA_0E08658g1_1 [Lachancea sp. 'fantastica']
MTTVPRIMKAVVFDGEKAVLNESVPVPKVNGTQILVKVKAVAGNPTDWKHVDYKIAPKGSILGCDVAGVVVELGPKVDKSRFSVGDAVAGLVHGGSVKFPDNGGHAEYASLDSLLSYKLDLSASTSNEIPEGPVKTYEAAASLPVSLLTAGAVLTMHLGNKLEWDLKTPQHDFPILIWGGATGVGQLLVQVAKQLHGYSKIVVVASKKHTKLLTQYGADEVFDYHDKDVIEQITKKYGGFQALVDGVSTPETFQQVYKCAADKATIVPLMLLSEKDIPESERKEGVKIDATLLYLASGYDVPFGTITIPANPGYREGVIRFINASESRIKDGKLHHIAIRVYQEGLKSVPQILDDIKNGVNSGEKLVASL